MKKINTYKRIKNNVFRFVLLCGIISFFPVFLNAQTTEYNYATGNVKGRSHVGGLIGSNSENGASITNSYSRGSVTGETNVGGFAGSSNGTIEECYSTGNVTGNTTAGGFAGLVTGTVNSSYWDMQTSSKSSSAGGLGRNTIDMTYPYAAGTYTGWDFNNVWKADQTKTQNNGYPVLLPSEVYRLELRIVPVGAGTVSGAGFYKTSQPVQVNAIPGELFVFKGWINGAEIISTQLQYNLPLSKNTTLIARFESKSTATEKDIILSVLHFVLYPNPVNDILWIDASGLSEKVTSFSVINLVGQVVKNFKTDANTKSITSIEVSDLKPGMYLLKADLGKEFMLEKFIKN